MGFHGEALLAPRPTPKLEDHPLSAVRDCLFNLFAATFHIGGRSSIRNLRTRHAVVTGTHLSHGTIHLAGETKEVQCLQMNKKYTVESFTLMQLSGMETEVIYYIMRAHLVTEAFDFNSEVNPSKLHFGNKL